VIAPTPSVYFRDTALISTVIRGNVMLVLTGTQPTPDVRNSFVGEQVTNAALWPLGNVCHL
jgi:hypothetical protein